MAHNFFDLTGKTAIVTGASRGLGQYMGRALARAGADLVITSRSVDALKDFVKEVESLGRKAIPLPLDVRNYESIQNFGKEVQRVCEKIDILVNNAGCNIRKPSVDVSWEDWDTVVNTNLKGMFFVTQVIVKRMIERRYGKIINIGSVTSVMGYGGIAPYCASRGGVRQMTMSLADEWGPFGITVNCLAPGWFKTAQSAVLYANQEWVEYLTDRIPLKRPGKPDDLDGMVVFLASDASEYVTGQTLLVDGGISTGAVRALLKK